MSYLHKYDSVALMQGFFIDATLAGANQYGDIKEGAQIILRGYLTTAKL